MILIKNKFINYHYTYLYISSSQDEQVPWLVDLGLLKEHSQFFYIYIYKKKIWVKLSDHRKNYFFSNTLFVRIVKTSFKRLAEVELLCGEITKCKCEKHRSTETCEIFSLFTVGCYSYQRKGCEYWGFVINVLVYRELQAQRLPLEIIPALKSSFFLKIRRCSQFEGGDQDYRISSSCQQGF